MAVYELYKWRDNVCVCVFAPKSVIFIPTDRSQQCQTAVLSIKSVLVKSAVVSST